MQSARHLVQEPAGAQVLDLHGVVPAVKDGLKLPVQVAQEHEVGAHQLPLRQLCPGVQLDLRDLVHHGPRVCLWAPSFGLILVDVVLDGLPLHQHRCTMPQRGHDLLLLREELLQAVHDPANDVGLPHARRTRQQEALVLDPELCYALHQILEFVLQHDLPHRLLEPDLLRPLVLLLRPGGHFAHRLLLEVEHRLSGREGVALQQLVRDPGFVHQRAQEEGAIYVLSYKL